MKIFKSLATIALALFLTFMPAKSLGKEHSKKIPILMYHSIDYGKGVMSVTPENFRSHLEKLYDKGYVTAKLEDIILDKIKSEKPVVLRFDDSRASQFRYVKDGKGNAMIDKKCAVGIILDFYQQHKEFGKHAIFFVIPHVEFHQPEYTKQKLEFLLKEGMEIGNHGYYHEDLTYAKPEDIDKNFGKAMHRFEQILGENAKRIRIIATPYGSEPKYTETKKELREFKWQGKKYKTLGIVYAYGKYNKLCPSRSSEKFNQYELPSLEVTNKNFDKIMDMLKD